MKKLILITLLSLIGLFGYNQTVTNNFEDGNWLYYYNLCWGIGPNDPYFGTKVTANTNQGFNNTFVCETENMGSKTSCILESPWTNLSVGNITFDHAVPSFNGVRTLKVYIVDQNNTSTLLFTHNYSNSTPISSIVSNGTTGIYKVRWQWISDGKGNSRGQLDNIVIPGDNVSDPSNDCQVYVPPVPPDTIINYYPSTDTSTLAFEDLWPSYGDYDMNDLVMGYKFKILSNSQSYVYDVYVTFIVRAQGAGLSNGFGFQFPNVEPSLILSVNGVGDQSGYIINSNGTESGQSKATFIIFDNTHKFMSSWNTIKGQIPCPWKTFNVYIKFVNNSVSLQNLSIQSWNPFIVKNGIRGQEIHLPDYKPTDLVDISLFGTNDDDTRLEMNKYYKSKRNHPWALDIYGKFEYPIENSDVSKAYLHFGEWAESSGTVYQDWWLNTSSGYRNQSLIY